MKNSWRVILAFSQNSLGKQFRNDLMQLKGYCTPSKNKQTNKQTKTKTKQNKNNKTKQNKTKQKKHVLCSISKSLSTPF